MVLKMREIAAFLLAIFVLSALAACSSASAPPANYYDNDLHHGYPGPAVADPSAI
jgi:hypothetical protein